MAALNPSMEHHAPPPAGPLGLYKGLGATFLRLGPHTIILWMVQEQALNQFERRFMPPPP